MLISKFDTAGIETKVAEFEEKYTITLPEQYRKFLLRYNGGGFKGLSSDEIIEFVKRTGGKRVAGNKSISGIQWYQE